MTYLQRIEALLDMPSGQKAEVLRELESHFGDIRDELISSGMEPSKADSEAELRMGPPEDVAARLTAAYNVASWRSTVLAVAPFLFPLISVLSAAFAPAHLRIVPVLLVTVITGIACVRELVRGRRPVWLATWLAAALVSAGTFIEYMTAATVSDPGVLVHMKATAFSALVLGAAAVTVAVVGRRWQWAAIIPFVICCACAFAVLRNGPTLSVSFFPVLAVSASELYFLILLARMVFELHPYGNGTQASLLILTVFVLGYPTLSVHERFLQAGFDLPVGAAVVWVLRARTHNLKEGALSLAVLILAASTVVSWNHWRDMPHLVMSLFYLVMGIAVYYSVIRSLVFIPISMENQRRTQAEPPMIAQ